MPSGDSEREEITITKENGPGLWYCARHAILERHGFPDVESFQRRLVIWLRDNYRDMLEDPDAGTEQLFFKLGSRISIPGKQETAEIIGGVTISAFTGTGEIPIRPRLTDIELQDKEGNKIEGKWIMGKPLVVSVNCRNGGGQAKVKFAVYQKENDGGYERKEEGLEGIKTEGVDRYTLEWKYEYGGEELKSKPKVYIKAYGDNIEETDSKEIEIGMEIKLVVVDDDYVVLGKAKIDIEFSKNEQKKEQQSTLGKSFPDQEADDEGKYQWEGLIPDQVSITVRTPIKRSYPSFDANGEPKKYMINPDTDKLIDTLGQIDGSEIIKSKIAGISQNQALNANQNPAHELDIGKLNVIKLPVRYLDSSNTNIVVPNQNQMSECEFIEYMLGNSYFGTPVDISRIQIYKGLPTPKQLKELIGEYQVSLSDPAFSLAISTEQSIGQVIVGTPAMSLPNGIIYLPSISTPYEKALFVHEAFHQFQYTHGVLGDVFKNLIQEMWDDKTNPNGSYDPYDYLSHAGTNVSSALNIQSLNQIGTLEGRAKFIEDFVRTVYGIDVLIHPLSYFIPALKTNKDTSGINTKVIL